MRLRYTAAIPVLAGALVLGGCGASGPSQSKVQSQILTFLHNNSVGAGSVSCNMPSNWKPGVTFKCFVYTGSSKELGTVTGTVLTGKNSYNEEYNPLG